MKAAAVKVRLVQPPTEKGRAGNRHRIVYWAQSTGKFLRAGKPWYLTLAEAIADAKQVNSKNVWVISEHVEILDVQRV